MTRYPCEGRVSSGYQKGGFVNDLCVPEVPSREGDVLWRRWAFCERDEVVVARHRPKDLGFGSRSCNRILGCVLPGKRSARNFRLPFYHFFFCVRFVVRSQAPCWRGGWGGGCPHSLASRRRRRAPLLCSWMRALTLRRIASVMALWRFPAPAR